MNDQYKGVSWEGSDEQRYQVMVKSVMDYRHEIKNAMERSAFKLNGVRFKHVVFKPLYSEAALNDSMEKLIKTGELRESRELIGMSINVTFEVPKLIDPVDPNMDYVTIGGNNIFNRHITINFHVSEDFLLDAISLPVAMEDHMNKTWYELSSIYADIKFIRSDNIIRKKSS